MLHLTKGQLRRQAANEARKKWKETGVITHLPVTTKGTQKGAGGEGVRKTEPPAPPLISPRPHINIGTNANVSASVTYPGVAAIYDVQCLNKRLAWVWVGGKRVTAVLPRVVPRKWGRGSQVRVECGADGKWKVVGVYTRYGVLLPDVPKKERAKEDITDSLTLYEPSALFVVEGNVVITTAGGEVVGV